MECWLPADNGADLAIDRNAKRINHEKHKKQKEPAWFIGAKREL